LFGNTITLFHNVSITGNSVYTYHFVQIYTHVILKAFRSLTLLLSLISIII